MNATPENLLRRCRDFRWEGVEARLYKEEPGASFRAISRHALFDDAALGCELRYFEMAPGGHSSLERHEHTHAVMILRGRGHCLLGTAVHRVAAFDLLTIPAWTWHQFRATEGAAFGFLCMVNRNRDRPSLPNAEELAVLRATPSVAAFLDGDRPAELSRR